MFLCCWSLSPRPATRRQGSCFLVCSLLCFFRVERPLCYLS
jgi:hypothetical protein